MDIATTGQEISQVTVGEGQWSRYLHKIGGVLLEKKRKQLERQCQDAVESCSHNYISHFLAFEQLGYSTREVFAPALTNPLACQPNLTPL